MIRADITQVLTPWQPVNRTEWRFDQIKYHYDVILGKMLQNTAQDADDVEVPYLKAQHVQWNAVQINELPTMWASSREINVLRVREGDLIVCEGGEVGRAAIVRNEPPTDCIIQNALHLVRPKPTGDVRFLRYLLQHATTNAWLDVLCNRATIAHFTAEKFREMWIWLPSLPEQRAIVNYLDRATAKIDTLIADKERLLDLLAEKRRALITHAVTRGLDASVPLRDSGVEWLGEIPKHWAVVKIKWLFDTVSGGTPNTSNQEEYYNGDIPWLRTIDLNNGELTSAEIYITEKALKDTACKLVPTNSVLIAMYGGGGTIGKHSILRFESAINQAICAILPTNNYNSDFLHYFLEFFRPYWMITAEGTRRDPNIGQDQIRDTVILVPPLSEQQQVIRYLADKTTQLAKLYNISVETIELLTERRTALIASAVTGKLRLDSSCNSSD